MACEYLAGQEKRNSFLLFLISGTDLEISDDL